MRERGRGGKTPYAALPNSRSDMLWANNLHEEVLDNGLVVVIHDYPEDVGGVVMLYTAGSSCERIGKTGVAHVLEHLMFNGTKRFAPFSLYVDSWGGQDNAFTDRDVAVYHTSTPASKVKDVLTLEADRMVNLSFTNFHAEKRVVMEEHLLGENEDDELLWNEVFSQLWPDSPYSNPVGGWPEDVEGLEVEDVVGFYDEFYTPNNAVLTVVSPMDVDEVLAHVEEVFGDIPPNPNLRLPKHGHPPYAWRKFSDVRANRPRRFVMAFRLDRPDVRYNAALNVLTRILDLERSSPLWGLVEDRRLTLFNVRVYEYLGGNVFAIAGEVPIGSTPPYTDILSILSDLKPEEEMVERVKRMLKSEFIFSLEEVESLALNVALTRYLFGRVPGFDESVEIINGVSVKDVEEVLAQVIRAPLAAVHYT